MEKKINVGVHRIFPTHNPSLYHDFLSYEIAMFCGTTEHACCISTAELP